MKIAHTAKAPPKNTANAEPGVLETGTKATQLGIANPEPRPQLGVAESEPRPQLGIGIAESEPRPQPGIEELEPRPRRSVPRGTEPRLRIRASLWTLPVMYHLAICVCNGGANAPMDRYPY